MAADPGFATDGYLYLLYTYGHDLPQHSGSKTARPARYTVAGDAASPSSEVVLLGKTAGASCNVHSAPHDSAHSGHVSGRTAVVHTDRDEWRSCTNRTVSVRFLQSIYAPSPPG